MQVRADWGARMPGPQKDLGIFWPGRVDSARKQVDSFAQKERAGQLAKTFQSTQRIGKIALRGSRDKPPWHGFDGPPSPPKKLVVAPPEPTSLAKGGAAQPSLVAQLVEQRIVNP